MARPTILFDKYEELRQLVLDLGGEARLSVSEISRLIGCSRPTTRKLIAFIQVEIDRVEIAPIAIEGRYACLLIRFPRLQLVPRRVA